MQHIVSTKQRRGLFWVCRGGAGIWRQRQSADPFQILVSLVRRGSALSLTADTIVKNCAYCGRDNTPDAGGQDFPRSRPHPKDPSGTIWDEDKVAQLYPKLAEKYDYEG